MVAIVIYVYLLKKYYYQCLKEKKIMKYIKIIYCTV